MICQGCGGVVGRDCFNPQECLWISQQQEQQQNPPEPDYELLHRISELESELATTKTALQLEKEPEDRWIAVSERLPPFGEKVWFRAEVPWHRTNPVRHFEDTLTTQTETVEYGQICYILEDNSDFLVTDSSFPKSDLGSEYVTHWQPLPSAPIKK